MLRKHVRRVVAAILLAFGLVGLAHAQENATPRTLPTPGMPGFVYVALGDSTVQGIGASSADATYPSRIAASLRPIYPDARLENLGVAGAVASDVVTGQLERAVAVQPTLVTLSVGPNDVTGRISADDYAQNVQYILRTLAERTSALVVVNLLPDLTLTPRYARSPRRREIRRRVAELNAILKRTGAVWNAVVVDLYGESRRQVPGHPELFAADGYHPSDAGYARWAEAVWHAIARRLPSPTSSPSGVVTPTIASDTPSPSGVATPASPSGTGTGTGTGS
jgi:lysophospholipase L1-like esterase